MSWVIRRPGSTYRPGEHYYFTGAGVSSDPKSAVRFTNRHWAVGMLKVLKFTGYSVIKRVRPKRHRCQCVCCPCLVKQ